MTGTAHIIHGNALALPLPDASVDLVVTSPPYFGLRSYQDGGEHYVGQIGAEPTPAEFVDALIAATREMVRVLKPSGSIWLNLGDKYSSGGCRGAYALDTSARRQVTISRPQDEARPKSLLGIPWRYALRCIDDLGLILRAEVIWSKPNGLPESVTDRVRRSHEQWFHFTKEPRYFSAVDEIREEHINPSDINRPRAGKVQQDRNQYTQGGGGNAGNSSGGNPLGKLPGSVWTIATQPLQVPAHLGIDHFAAFPMEWPRRIIRGWSPAGVCSACGFLLGSSYDSGMLGVRKELRTPNPQRGASDEVLLEALLEQEHSTEPEQRQGLGPNEQGLHIATGTGTPHGGSNGLCNGAPTADVGKDRARPPALRGRTPSERDQGRQPTRESRAIGEAGSRPDLGFDSALQDRLPPLRSRDTRVGVCPHCGSSEVGQGVVLDDFGGTGTTALMAKALGRTGISVDMSADYCRLAEWRTNDRGQMAAALQVEKPDDVSPDQLDLFGDLIA